MTDLVAELVLRVKVLSAEDRTLVVELLRETLDEPVDPDVEDAWSKELRSRTAAYEKGNAVLFDADEVIAEAMRLVQ